MDDTGGVEAWKGKVGGKLSTGRVQLRGNWAGLPGSTPVVPTLHRGGTNYWRWYDDPPGRARNPVGTRNLPGKAPDPDKM